MTCKIKDARLCRKCSVVTAEQQCDFCGKRDEVKFHNLTRVFCSVECVNGYLRNEGFSHRVCKNCERKNIPAGNFVCDDCSAAKVSSDK